MQPAQLGREPGSSGGDTLNFAVVFAGIVLTIAVAVALALFAGLSLPSMLIFRWSDALLGTAATTPLFALLAWFMTSRRHAIAAFRESQIEFLSELGFRFTPPRVVLMALGAGFSEELLFRGVLQGWIAMHAPIWVAILAPNILFGLLHARTTLYAIVAGLVGVYFGVLYWASGSLWAPIIAHALYDLVALEIARRLLAARQPRPADSSRSSSTG
jgi:membrane protease YdiL (CAAX protease family)